MTGVEWASTTTTSGLTEQVSMVSIHVYGSECHPRAATSFLDSLHQHQYTNFGILDLAFFVYQVNILGFWYFRVSDHYQHLRFRRILDFGCLVGAARRSPLAEIAGNSGF